jgi:DNA-binding IclR family transcriptional regulator
MPTPFGFDTRLLDFLTRHPRAISVGEMAVGVAGNADPSTARRVRRSVARLRLAGFAIERPSRGAYRLRPAS